MIEDKLKKIIDQIIQGQHTESELSQLDQILCPDDNRQILRQEAKYIINI